MQCSKCETKLDTEVSTEHFEHEDVDGVPVHTTERCLAAQLVKMTKERNEWNGAARRDVAKLKVAIRDALECIDEGETPTATERLRAALGS